MQCRIQIELPLLHIYSPQMFSEPYFGVLFGCKMWKFWHRMAAILCFASQLRSANWDLTVKPGSANQIWINIPLLQNLFLASNVFSIIFRSSVRLENEEVSIQAAMLTRYRGGQGGLTSTKSKNRDTQITTQAEGLWLLLRTTNLQSKEMFAARTFSLNHWLWTPLVY